LKREGRAALAMRAVKCNKLHTQLAQGYRSTRTQGHRAHTHRCRYSATHRYSHTHTLWQRKIPLGRGSVCL